MRMLFSVRGELRHLQKVICALNFELFVVYAVAQNTLASSFGSLTATGPIDLANFPAKITLIAFPLFRSAINWQNRNANRLTK